MRELILKKVDKSRALEEEKRTIFFFYFALS